MVQAAAAACTAQIQRLVQELPVKETMAAQHNLTAVRAAVVAAQAVQAEPDRDPPVEMLATASPTASLAQRRSTQAVVSAKGSRPAVQQALLAELRPALTGLQAQDLAAAVAAEAIPLGQ